MTAFILSVGFAGKEFLRVGYYVYNYYPDEKLAKDDPVVPIISRIERRIIDDKPRITIFNIFKKGKDGKLESTTDSTFESINQKLIQMQKEGDNCQLSTRLDLTKIHHSEEEKSEVIPNESSDPSLSNSNS